MSLIPDDGGDRERMHRSKSEATAKGGQAFLRLRSLAEAVDSGARPALSRFIASTYNDQDFPYDLYDLRLMDVTISDNMPACLDALRWAQTDLHTPGARRGSTRQGDPDALGPLSGRDRSWVQAQRP